jgi:hypothetical protein
MTGVTMLEPDEKEVWDRLGNTFIYKEVQKTSLAVAEVKKTSGEAKTPKPWSNRRTADFCRNITCVLKIATKGDGKFAPYTKTATPKVC